MDENTTNWCDVKILKEEFRGHRKMDGRWMSERENIKVHQSRMTMTVIQQTLGMTSHAEYCS